MKVFFLLIKKYQQNVANFKNTYKILYGEITNSLKNSKELLDIGHGGIFDYDTSKLESITGLDLGTMIEPEVHLPKKY